MKSTLKTVIDKLSRSNNVIVDTDAASTNAHFKFKRPLQNQSKMDVYTFEKSYLERLKEAEAVLSWDGAAMPASQVRSEWKSYVELQMEPTGN